MGYSSKHFPRLVSIIITMTVAAGILLSACNIGLDFLVNPTPIPPTETDQNLPMALVTFEVYIPPSLVNNAKIGVEILDEVTGLALNPTRYSLEGKANSIFTAQIPFVIGSVIKYRYIRQGNPSAIEYTSTGKQVRYRLYSIGGPALIQDTVSAWNDVKFDGPIGRIQGRVIDEVNNAPLPNILVAAGGAQTFTASDGSYLLEGLAPGTHNLVIYSLDGKYKTFQQGATVAENATTPADIRIPSTTNVNVTFVVKTPPGNIKGLPVRFIGNIYSLGNTFADLDGGMSVIASRAPFLVMQEDGSYRLTLNLPSGLDLQYKYSLGDGFWNAEHRTNGDFRVRQLIVPSQDAVITDTIDTWQSGEFAPITFAVKVPANTPVEDKISIQFNPYGWTSPIPMWPLGNNQWLYVLYSPLDMMGNVGYRYCRNDQCGSADDYITKGATSAGLPFAPTKLQQTFQDDVREWAWWNPGPQTPITVPSITNRGDAFIAGIEYLDQFNPTWQAYEELSINNLKTIGANWLVLTPTWTYTRYSPPVMEPVAGSDPLWFDLSQSINKAKQQGLNVALYPRIHTDIKLIDIWQNPPADASWWQNWFDRYRTMILHHADMANQTNAGLLIIGGPDVAPAIPGGKLSDGSSSGVPDSIRDQWNQLIKDIRSRYSGKIGWAVRITESEPDLPSWIGDVDLIYALVSTKLAESNAANPSEIEQKFGALFDNTIYPIFEKQGKSIVIAINYPSIDGATSGCVQTANSCLSFESLNQPNPDNSNVAIDLQEQADIYNAALTAINQRIWIAGFVSQGYYPPTVLQDKSSSIHGKPAADILWYWYPRLLGKSNP